MKARDYPELAQHRILHERLTQKTIDLYRRLDADTGQDLLVFLKEWWVNHICQVDKQYSPYMGPVHTG